MRNLTLSGAPVALSQTPYLATANVGPFNAAQPITYVWQASHLSPVTHNGGLSDSIVLTWNLTGTQKVTVTVSNGLASPLSGTLTLDVHALNSRVYFPILAK